MAKRNHDEYGREIPDPRPMEIPVGFKRPETLQEQIQRLVRYQVSAIAQNEGYETFEESEDFDVDDGDDVNTPYEMEFDPVLGREISPQMLRDQPERYRREYVERAMMHPDTENHVKRVEKKRSMWPFKKRQADVEEVAHGPQAHTPEAGGQPRRDSGGSTPT